eukprot:COSAG03_NODE_6943_length_984_cov_1.189831_1_plen_58_part_00
MNGTGALVPPTVSLQSTGANHWQASSELEVLRVYLLMNSYLMTWAFPAIPLPQFPPA